MPEIERAVEAALSDAPIEAEVTSAGVDRTDARGVRPVTGSLAALAVHARGRRHGGLGPRQLQCARARRPRRQSVGQRRAQETDSDGGRRLRPLRRTGSRWALPPTWRRTVSRTRCFAPASRSPFRCPRCIDALSPHVPDPAAGRRRTQAGADRLHGLEGPGQRARPVADLPPAGQGSAAGQLSERS